MKNKLFLAVLLLATSNVFAQFSQTPLPYAYNALEPNIDAQTMEIHYSKHHAGYVKNLNEALKGNEAANQKIETILANISKHSTAVRNNAGGHYNHELFWSILTPNRNNASTELVQAINSTFKSLDGLKTKLNDAATKRFGSGWAWLSVNDKGELFISSTANQDNPLMDNASKKGTPILGIDVWEHAYYLKYQNKRGDYLASIWNVINWEEVSRRYAEAKAGK